MNRSRLLPLLLLFAGVSLVIASFFNNDNQSSAAEVALAVPTEATLEPTEPAPSETPSPEPTATNEPTDVPPTNTPEPTSTKLPTLTPSPTAEPLNIVIVTPGDKTNTPEADPTRTPEPILPTKTPTPEVQATATQRATNTPRATATAVPTRVTATPRPTQQATSPSAATNTPLPTWTPLPTKTPVPTWTPQPSPTPLPTNTPWPTNTPAPAATTPSNPTPAPPLGTFNIPYRERFGILGNANDARTAAGVGLPYGSFMTWGLSSEISADVETWQMVRVSQSGPRESLQTIGNAVTSNPGAIWVIGNEPDVIWQDNVTAFRYAEIYHDLYYFIKEKDPTAKVAVGGVSTPTPLRRFYLELMLNHYQDTYGEALPTDIWTVHAYVLREERNSWGVDIPPGLGGVDTGELFEIEDHAKYWIVNQMLTEFRAFLSARGYDVPLAITEFGILLPSDYGFPPEVVSEFMEGSINYYLSAAGASGYSGDGNKLVQWWFWFSVVDRSGEFSVSDLIDRNTNTITQIGNSWAAYLR